MSEHKKGNSDSKLCDICLCFVMEWEVIRTRQSSSSKEQWSENARKTKNSPFILFYLIYLFLSIGIHILVFFFKFFF
jgi:hypothetical protein